MQFQLVTYPREFEAQTRLLRMLQVRNVSALVGNYFTDIGKGIPPISAWFHEIFPSLVSRVGGGGGKYPITAAMEKRPTSPLGRLILHEMQRSLATFGRVWHAFSYPRLTSWCGKNPPP